MDLWETLSAAQVEFSDCGSFCFLTIPYDGILILKSNLLKESVAKVQTPAVWGNNTSYNQRFFGVGWNEKLTMVTLYQAHDAVGRYGLRDTANEFYPSDYSISVAITAIPAHLASGRIYLLAGKSGDDLARMLFLPKKGPPEIKDLRVTLNQILDELATRSAERQSAYSKSIGSTTEEDTSDIGSEEALVYTDEDLLRANEEESSDTRSEVAAMSADDVIPGFSDSDESSDTRSQEAAMSADDHIPGFSDSN